MRLPNRKPGKYTFPTFDPNITEAKFQALQNKLDHLKKVAQPNAAKDTQKFGENGDFSENAEYQIAKGRLRGINRAIDELQYQLASAKIIPSPTDTTTIQIGHTVTIATACKHITFTILGSTETNPSAGIISYQSPLGAALIGHSLGEIITLNIANNAIKYTIIEIAQA